MKALPHNALAPRRAAFTLIETLAVVLVLSLIVALSAPAMLGALRASRLTSAGDLLMGKLVEAQALALTYSSDVELRVYKAPASHVADGRSGQHIQILQWAENDPVLTGQEGIASLKTMGPREVLPEGVAISLEPTFSSVWNLPTQTETTTSGDQEYVAIRFRPDGSTDLHESRNWHFTLVELHHINVPDLPPNFYTVQVDPVSSKLEVYRPE